MKVPFEELPGKIRAFYYERDMTGWTIECSPDGLVFICCGPNGLVRHRWVYDALFEWRLLHE